MHYPNPNPKIVIDYSAEVKLRRNNPSVKHAWKELTEATENYCKYSMKINQEDRTLTESDQKYLEKLDARALEQFRNYSFVLKLARD